MLAAGGIADDKEFAFERIWILPGAIVAKAHADADGAAEPAYVVIGLGAHRQCTTAEVEAEFPVLFKCTDEEVASEGVNE